MKQQLKMVRWLMAASLWLPAACAGAQESPPPEVSAKDWSYQAVEDLANRGLVHGYKDAKFLQGRKLSRFELASLVKRVIDNVMEVPVPTSDKPLVPETPGTAAARGQGREQPPLGRPLSIGSLARTTAFTEGDLGTIRRLSDEFSVELAVMGVNMQGVMERLEDLSGRIESIESSLRDPEGPLQTVISNVARIDKIRFSGYIQARYQTYENTSEANTPARTPPTSSGADGRGPRDPHPPATGTFAVRRARFVVAARPTDKIGARLQVDAAAGSIRNEVELRDAWIDYFFTGNPATGHTMTFGQMKVPFGFEVVQSSGVRETPERARIARFFFPDERDRGVKLASSTGNKYFYEVGLYNGIQLGSRTFTSGDDNNNDKDVAGRIRTTLFKRLDVGVSGYWGTTLRTAAFPGESGIDAANPREERKWVAGADAQWFVLDGTVVRGEFMIGETLGTDVSGYILQLIHNLGTKNQLVAKYDWFGTDKTVLAPVGPAGNIPGAYGNLNYIGTLSTVHLGLIHFLDSSTRLKLFYEIHDRGREVLVQGDTRTRFPWLGNVLRFEVITVF
jgi:phosphate-selective porin O/P